MLAPDWASSGLHPSGATYESHAPSVGRFAGSQPSCIVPAHCPKDSARRWRLPAATALRVLAARRGTGLCVHLAGADLAGPAHLSRCDGGDCQLTELGDLLVRDWGVPE